MTDGIPREPATTDPIASSMPAAPRQADTDTFKRFSRYFEVIPADRPELVDRAYEIRYEVYCLERGFEDRSEHPDGRETDEFDDRAVHSLLIHRPSGNAVGTVRLVLPIADALDQSFAIQRVTDLPLLKDPAAFPVGSMAEISRFSISKKFRRRADDTPYGPPETAAARSEAAERRITPPMRLGLMQAIVTMSAEYGITHWCAVMEPTLLRILAASAIHFEPVGPVVNYHGRRQPCYGSIAAILNRLHRERPEVWDVVTRQGEAWARLCRSWAERGLTHALASNAHA